jgi:signal transduction histidine kinase
MRIRPGGDAVLASVVTVASVTPLLLPHRQVWWLIALGFAASVPIAWRRRALVPVTIVVGSATMAMVLTLTHRDVLVLMPYGGLVCAYTFATLDRLAPRVGAVVLMAAGVIVTLVIPHEDLETYRYVGAVYVASYALGVGTRARRAQRRAEEERTRRLAEERATAVERERTRIARDMHDIVTHSVGLMVVQAEAGPLVVRNDPARAEAAFEAIADTGREAIGRLRLILDALRGDGGREPQPGLDTLRDLVERTRRAGLDASFEERGTPVPVPAEVGVAAYRIVQESLTNTLRHSAARTVRVILAWADSSLTVEVRDDGGSTAAPREGHGITGMRERAHACGGRLDIDPSGFAVTATLPTG